MNEVEWSEAGAAASSIKKFKNFFKAGVVGYKFAFSCLHSLSLHSFINSLYSSFVVSSALLFFNESRKAKRSKWRKSGRAIPECLSLRQRGSAHNQPINEINLSSSIQSNNNPIVLFDGGGRKRKELKKEEPQPPFRNQRNSNQFHQFFLFELMNWLICFCWLLHSLTAQLELLGAPLAAAGNANQISWIK